MLFSAITGDTRVTGDTGWEEAEGLSGAFRDKVVGTGVSCCRVLFNSDSGSLSKLSGRLKPVIKCVLSIYKIDQDTGKPVKDSSLVP
jgi:hypothetical protein